MFALLPLVVSLVPTLARWLFGDGSDATQTQVAKTVQTLVGTTDPVDAQRMVHADPALAQRLTLELARIDAAKQTEADAAMQARLVAQLNDVQNARQQTVALASVRSLVAWGAPAYSLMILSAFVYAEYLAWHTTGAENAVQIGLVETIKVLMVAVGTYWVGSSAGSMRKSNDLSVARNQIYNSVPASEVAKVK